VGRPECQGIAPRIGDIVHFRQGTYAVTITGAQSSLIAEFGIAGPPPFDPHDITFSLPNAYTIGQLYSSGILRVHGGGSLSIGEFFLGDRGSMLVNNTKVILSAVHPGLPPADATAQLQLSGREARLSTTSSFGLAGVRIDGGQWTHTGPATPGHFSPREVHLLNQASFSAEAILFGQSGDPLRAEGESTFTIGTLTGGTVLLSGGSRMINNEVSNVRTGGGTNSSVSGVGSSWMISGALRMTDAFGQITIGEGGSLASDLIAIDDFGTTLTARGNGSRVTAGSIELGIANRGNLRIQSGARVETTAGFVGGQTTGGGSVNVVGPGSTWISISGLLIGDAGTGGMQIFEGGLVRVGTPSALGIGFAPSGVGSAWINGNNSVLDARGAEVAVGKRGSGNVRVTEGGVIFAHNLDVGDEAGSRGSIEVSQVTGGGTALDMSGRLTVGKQGHGTLVISGPATGDPFLRASVQALSLSIGESPTNNLLRASGAGAYLRVRDTIHVGNGGNGVLRLNTAAEADCQELQIGLDPRSRDEPVQGSVEITSPGTVFTVRGRLNVGYQDVGTLTLRDGARLRFLNQPPGEFDIGSTRTGFGAVAVAGSDAVLEAAGALLTIGNEGDGVLEISKGGRMTNQTARLGARDFGAGHATVGNKDGDRLTTSRWGLEGPLEIGAGNFGTLFILDAGEVHAGEACLGCEADSSGHIVASGMATLSLSNGLRVAVGERTPPCALLVHNGASVRITAGTLDLGLSPNSEALMSLQLPGSALRASNSPARIGVNGSAFAEVLLGAQLLTGMADIGLENSSTGTVYLGGTNSVWQVNGALRVGVAGEGYLIADAGSEVRVNGPITTGERGRLSGSGRIISSLLSSSGVTSPGSSVGTLEINGNLVQTAEGMIEIEIAGTTPGSLHDVLRIAGNAELAGRLTVTFIDGFAPESGQVFTFLQADGTLNGDFAETEVTGVAPGFQYELRRTADGRGWQFAALSDGVASSQPEPPRIAIDRFGPNVVVSWTAPTSGYLIQGRTNLTGGDWTDYGSTHRLNLSPTNASQIFRIVSEPRR
jgi:T5SS/PEP-CTERM-associated repeat protein